MTERDKIITECQMKLVQYAFTSLHWSWLENIKDEPRGKKNE